DFIFTGLTLACLPAGTVVRRLASVQAVNNEEPIDLYQIVGDAPNDWQERCQRYAEALEALERNNRPLASELAERMAAEYPHDAAARALAERAASSTDRGYAADTSVWQLPGK
ncbi:MAG TPA: hypothetical protein PJ982_19545, partial [Lacipirellulaceae bacterium]|nr:hypothetical protein [Lacipirellulaceae bacterium]